MRLRDTLIAVSFLTLSTNIIAEELDFYQLDRAPGMQLQFDDMKLGGFERYKLNNKMRVRGWQFGEKTYIGQTKVGKKWGLGFVFENGDTVYGVNHRGIQIMRRF